MTDRPAPLRQSDLTRYAKAMRAAGYEEWRVEVETDGKISIVAGKSEEDRTSDWDK